MADDWGDASLTDADGGACSLAESTSDAESGTLNWIARYGLTYDSWPSGVAIDQASGNIIATGYYYGTMNFGGGVLDGGNDANAPDGFVASFDPNGNYRWAKSFGNGTVSTGRIAFDNLGNAILTAVLSEGGSVDLGCGPVAASGGDAVLLIKLDASGNCVWNKSFAISNLAGVAADSNGNVFMAGEAIDGPVNFGGATLPNGFYIAKFNPSGAFLWNVNVSVSSWCDSATPSFAVDPSGNSLLAGCFIGTANFGGGTFTSQLGGDAFLAKYDPSGVYSWARDYPAPVDAGFPASEIASLGVDSCGNVFISGGGASIDFGSGVILSSNAGEFLAKIDPGGNGVWAKGFPLTNCLGYPAEGLAAALAVDGVGGVTTSNVLYSGTLADFGGGVTACSSLTFFVFASFDRDGNYRWAYSPQAPPATITRMGLGGIAASGRNVVLLGAFGGACQDTTCTTSPSSSNSMVIDGKTLTAVSAMDTFLTSIVP